MKPRHDRKLNQQEFWADLRKTLPQFVGAQARILQIRAVGGSAAPIVINLNGPDLAKLQSISDEALTRLRDVPGLIELKSSLEGRKPRVDGRRQSLPAAIALGAGAEFLAPMARAVIGGLITSTLLTLIVVPVVYTYLDDFGAWAGAWIKCCFAEPDAATVAGHTERPQPEPETTGDPVPGAVSPVRAVGREG